MEASPAALPPSGLTPLSARQLLRRGAAMRGCEGRILARGRGRPRRGRVLRQRGVPPGRRPAAPRAVGAAGDRRRRRASRPGRAGGRWKRCSTRCSSARGAACPAMASPTCGPWPAAGVALADSRRSAAGQPLGLAPARGPPQLPVTQELRTTLRLSVLEAAWRLRCRRAATSSRLPRPTSSTPQSAASSASCEAEWEATRDVACRCRARAKAGSSPPDPDRRRRLRSQVVPAAADRAAAGVDTARRRYERWLRVRIGARRLRRRQPAAPPGLARAAPRAAAAAAAAAAARRRARVSRGSRPRDWAGLDLALPSFPLPSPRHLAPGRKAPAHRPQPSRGAPERRARSCGRRRACVSRPCR